MQRSKVVIVGAGPAGIRAAEILIVAGVRPVLIDEAWASGGQIYRRPPAPLARAPKQLYGFEAGRATALHTRFDALRQQMDYRPETLVWNAQPGRLDIVTRDRPAALPWRQLIIATGAMDRVLPFEGWSCPGVYSLGAAQVALKGQACAIGRRVVFFGTGPLLYLVAYQYAKAGIEVAAVLNTAPRAARLQALPGLLRGGRTFAKGLYYVSWLKANRAAMRAGISPIAALPGDHGSVRSLVWRDASGARHETDCDAIGFGYGLRSETQLADLLDLRFEFDARQCQWLPVQSAQGRTSQPGIYLAGDGSRIMGADVAELAGERAACALLVDLGLTWYERRLRQLERSIRRADAFRRTLDVTAFPFPAHLARAAHDGLMICRCEGVTAGALRSAAREGGANELNHAKALSRIGMGRCQGRVCAPAAAEILSAELQVGIDKVGRFRGQAPLKPISLAALAAGGAS